MASFLRRIWGHHIFQCAHCLSYTRINQLVFILTFKALDHLSHGLTKRHRSRWYGRRHIFNGFLHFIMQCFTSLLMRNCCLPPVARAEKISKFILSSRDNTNECRTIYIIIVMRRRAAGQSYRALLSLIRSVIVCNYKWFTLCYILTH